MLRRLLTVLALTAMLVSPVVAFAETKSAFSKEQLAELDTIIKNYISSHPEVLISSVETHYNKQAETKQVQEGRVEQMPADMVDANTPVYGPKDAKVTVVEFFDYNCGYCKQVAGDVTRLIEEDKTVRVIFRELPIFDSSSDFSGPSGMASRYALAAHKQGKYLEFHNALMAHQGPMGEDFLIGLGKSLKLDTDKLKKDANLQDIRDSISKSFDMARTLGVRGTPFFLFGKEKVPGAIGYTSMKEMIAKERGDAPAAAPAAETDTKPAAATGNSNDPEIEKAKAEAKAMIEELKEEATKMQKEAMEQQKKLQADAEAQAEKEKAAKDKTAKE